MHSEKLSQTNINMKIKLPIPYNLILYHLLLHWSNMGPIQINFQVPNQSN